MKKYEEIEIEIIYFDPDEDIVTASIDTTPQSVNEEEES